jgi:hypothetical protein
VPSKESFPQDEGTRSGGPSDAQKVSREELAEIATELSIEGYEKMHPNELVKAILERR